MLPAAESRAWNSHLRRVAPAALLATLAVLAYARTFSAPFVFDDLASIVRNPTIRHLWPPTLVLHPPQANGATVGGRPLLNLSFALNHAISGGRVWSYHVSNLLIHVANALLLFGLVRRTLRPWGRLQAADITFAAFAAAALWLLHPLQTEAVTYVVQRAESLVSFFLLLTLYAFVRSLHAARPRCWLGVSVCACLLGMATKEVMVVAPVLVLLYDRTFAAGSWRAAWNARRGFYLGLAGTWLLLAALVAGTGAARGDTAGLGVSLSPVTYALTQGRAVLHYLRLAAWPQPLVFDYGNDVVRGGREVWPQLVVLGAALAGTVAALRWRPRVGFLAAVFFLILAPSSSVVPIASQTMAEHRVYLALAAVCIAFVVLCGTLAGRAGLALAVLVALAGGAATFRRNEVYASALALWSDTAVHAPENARAQSNLGNALLAAGRIPAAIARYRIALRLRPDYADAHNNLGRALVQSGRVTDALPEFEAALRVKPRSVDILTNYASALAQVGRTADALQVDARALALAPDATAPRYNRANTLFHLGNFAGAAADYEAVLLADPGHLDARFNLAATLVRLGRVPEAVAQYEKLLVLAPDDAAAHAELGNLLAHTGHSPEAIAHYETALRLRPDFSLAREQLERLRSAALRSR